MQPRRSEDLPDSHQYAMAARACSRPISVGRDDLTANSPVFAGQWQQSPPPPEKIRTGGNKDAGHSIRVIKVESVEL